MAARHFRFPHVLAGAVATNQIPREPSRHAWSMQNWATSNVGSRSTISRRIVTGTSSRGMDTQTHHPGPHRGGCLATPKRVPLQNGMGDPKCLPSQIRVHDTAARTRNRSTPSARLPTEGDVVHLPPMWLFRRPVRARTAANAGAWLSAGGAGDERGDDVGGVPI